MAESRGRLTANSGRGRNQGIPVHRDTSPLRLKNGLVRTSSQASHRLDTPSTGARTWHSYHHLHCCPTSSCTLPHVVLTTLAADSLSSILRMRQPRSGETKGTQPIGGAAGAGVKICLAPKPMPSTLHGLPPGAPLMLFWCKWSSLGSETQQPCNSDVLSFFFF